MLQLTLHPEMQRRAQKELDAVTGLPDSSTYRLPTFEDREMLPYIGALVKETLRFMPPISLGLPHAATEDDEYRGWRIPKGAIIIFNAWGINRDENVYPEPERFNPDRFLRRGSEAPEPDPVAAWGFGRRYVFSRLPCVTVFQYFILFSFYLGSVQVVISLRRRCGWRWPRYCQRLLLHRERMRMGRILIYRMLRRLSLELSCMFLLLIFA
jgi:hypothetical protein